MPHVLITKIGGGIDYATDGDASVVLIDFDELDTAFPDRLEQLIAQVKALPRSMPWRSDVLEQLVSRREAALANLVGSEHRSIDLHPEMLTG